MKRIDASLPSVPPPKWAILERSLIDLMGEAVFPFLEKYTREDGSLIWHDKPGGGGSLDDAYESFYNWPLLYVLGGADHLLPISKKLFDGITSQYAYYGTVYKEYDKDADWFHQGEGYLFFYFLCLADPKDRKNLERAKRFAGFYLNEDPEVEEPIYDPERKLIRSWRVGSRGANFHVWRSYGWAEWSRPYGLPFEDVPGIESYEDLRDPEKARLMGEVMHRRMDRGDVAQNLAATSLLTNAFLLTGEEKYRSWVLDYVEAWIDRTRKNGGILPDNVGLSGEIGEYMDGKWWGGAYGWRVWHGFLNLGSTVLLAAFNALLLTGDRRYLEFPRSQIDLIMGQGIAKEGRFLVPFKHGDRGWFEYQDTGNGSYFLALVAHLWSMSMDALDWDRIRRLRELNTAKDWKEVATSWPRSHFNEAPWILFISGEYPEYPEKALLASVQHVYRRIDMIRGDKADLRSVNEHHWQVRNPVTTEALVQLTLGSPGILYFGGLLEARIRYFDFTKRRPGLPQDVAALVESLEAHGASISLVNLSPREARDVVLQAGAFGEHLFTEARYSSRVPTEESFIPRHERGGESPDRTDENCLQIDDKCLHVHMPPGTEIRLRLGMRLFTNRPSYAFPWDA
ncbi:MAG: hypothetical protein QXO94_05855 [Candidatus Bathyarchaeia archaeon]